VGSIVPQSSYHPRVKRRPVTLALFLLLGAAINIAVAWGLAMWVSYERSSHDSDGVIMMKGLRGPYIWSIAHLDDFGSRRMMALPNYESRGYPNIKLKMARCPNWTGWPAFLDMKSVEAVETEAAMNWPANTMALMPSAQMCDARGWPMLAMRGQLVSGPALPSMNNGWREAIALRPLPGGPPGVVIFHLERALPLWPIWPGFAINTLFYAAICWLLFAAPFAVRRMSHRRRGLCVSCGYDLRGRLNDAAACPECGHPYRCHGPER